VVPVVVVDLPSRSGERIRKSFESRSSYHRCLRLASLTLTPTRLLFTEIYRSAIHNDDYD